mgnify:CR=1 FL=1
MIKKTYIKPLLKSFLIEPMDFLAASPNPSGNAKGSISFSDDVTSGDNDDTDPWGEVDYIR